jgi:hypothetical protein
MPLKQIRENKKRLKNRVSDFNAFRGEAFSIPAGTEVAIIGEPRNSCVLICGLARIIDLDDCERQDARCAYVHPEELE